jgi:hypothetical protein
MSDGKLPDTVQGRALMPPTPDSIPFLLSACSLLPYCLCCISCHFDHTPFSELFFRLSVVCLFSIVALENLVLWWDSTSSVEKATRESVTQLVAMGEAIINSERGSWLSTPARDDDKDSKGKKPKGEVDKEGKSQ